jgi:uncharacterized protein (DUF924 family)
MKVMEPYKNVLEFWFGGQSTEQFGRARDEWFEKSPAFDAQIRMRFAGLHAAAAEHQLDDWKTTPRGWLALILVLDQFSRNLYRDSSQAFACDAHALELAQLALDAQLDRVLLPVERMFVYMPFQHSEAIDMQRRSLTLFESLHAYAETAMCYDYAIRHFEVIEKFGRFPHRNAVLGRTSTPAELIYLQQPGAGF